MKHIIDTTKEILVTRLLEEKHITFKEALLLLDVTSNQNTSFSKDWVKSPIYNPNNNDIIC